MLARLGFEGGRAMLEAEEEGAGVFKVLEELQSACCCRDKW